MKNYPTHTLFAVTQGEQQEKGTWTPIGVAFTNKGGILSIRFDEGKGPQTIPAGADLVLSVRQYRAKADSNQGGQQ